MIILERFKLFKSKSRSSEVFEYFKLDVWISPYCDFMSTMSFATIIIEKLGIFSQNKKKLLAFFFFFWYFCWFIRFKKILYDFYKFFGINFYPIQFSPTQGTQTYPKILSGTLKIHLSVTSPCFDDCTSLCCCCVYVSFFFIILKTALCTIFFFFSFFSLIFHLIFFLSFSSIAQLFNKMFFFFFFWDQFFSRFIHLWAPL